MVQTPRANSSPSLAPWPRRGVQGLVLCPRGDRRAHLAQEASGVCSQALSNQHVRCGLPGEIGTPGVPASRKMHTVGQRPEFPWSPHSVDVGDRLVGTAYRQMFPTSVNSLKGGDGQIAVEWYPNTA